MTRLRPSALALAALVGLAALATPADARADDPPKEQQQLPQRQATFTWAKFVEPEKKTETTLLRASFSYRDVIDKATADKLSSGLPTVIAMRAYLLREGDENPVALAVRSCRVVYDLWDEVYRIKAATSGGERDGAALNLEGVLRQCAEVRDLVVADRALVQPKKPYFLGVIVEVNPVSPKTLEQMRKWVSRPAGSTGIGPGDALFGSFVGLFVRQIGNADRTLRFRTQSLSRD